MVVSKAFRKKIQTNLVQSREPRSPFFLERATRLPSSEAVAILEQYVVLISLDSSSEYKTRSLGTS